MNFRQSFYIFLFLFFNFQIAVLSQDKIDLLILQKNYHAALLQIENKIQKHPQADLYFKKGFIFSQMQNYQNATKAFSLALELEPENTKFLEEIAEALSSLGNHYDATPFWEQAVVLQPEKHSIAGKLCRNYIQLDRFQKAYDIFAGIYQNDSTNVYWNKQFAFCAHQTGKTKQAITLYEKVLDINPRDYASYFNLIRLYQQTEQFGKALETIEKGLGNFPDDAGFYQQKATFLMGNRQYKDARLAYEQYFKAGGDSVYKVLMNYGITLYFTKDEHKAIQVLDICAGQLANDPYVLFYLSLSHKNLAQYQTAEAFMNAAIESATPSYLPEMYHHLGQIFGQQRKFEESIAALKKANELDPSNKEVLFEIATTYEEFNSNKTLALNYYRVYLTEAGESAQNVNYALDRIKKIKEDMFFEE